MTTIKTLAAGVRAAPLLGTLLGIALFILAAGFISPARAAEPRDMKSLQPFTTFAAGEGEGMARLYKSRDKGEFIDLLRNPRREMRIPCGRFVAQIVEAHPGLTIPLESCSALASVIEASKDFDVVACQHQMFLVDNWLTVTNEDGTAFGVWHRKCYDEEKVLTYKGQPVASTTCLNATIPVTARVTPPTPVALPKAPTLTQYALQINCMADRPDGYWVNRYELAKANRAGYLRRNDANKVGMAPYFEVFTKAPFGEMLAERKSRPRDCRFLVRFLKKEPVLDLKSGDTDAVKAEKYLEYLKRFQNPREEDVLTGQWVTTGARGWVIIPITMPLDQIEAVLVQPEQIGDVLEPVIAVHRPEFANQSNPIHIWEVSIK